MDRELYRCTAGDLATNPVETLPAASSVSDGTEWLHENGYDVAPVTEDGQPTGYVTVKDLSSASGKDTISNHTRPITLQEIISSDAVFREGLSALYQEPVDFLGGRNRVTGILTRADLNTSPAYIHLFDR